MSGRVNSLLNLLTTKIFQIIHKSSFTKPQLVFCVLLKKGIDIYNYLKNLCTFALKLAISKKYTNQ
ncbi:hypothetical protein B0A77_08655 [Flavobacterium branchiophilum]|uniref:Uncharacterized protein n=1 Tax=Flavobacterium branchiophilum TaxID=55197 RepID=A0A2H3KB96_9FLAO|nr:hypothetical protein B0A77_08655 [Flavobacterium branchiophilum]